MIRVAIVDDHAVVRQGLARLLELERDISVSFDVSDGRDALSALKSKECDVVIVDISLDGMDGLEVLKRIRTEHPATAVLILSMYPEEQYAVRALKAGASGYITKGNNSEEIVRGVRTIAEGGKYISPTVAEILVDTLSGPVETVLHHRLSDRELQILNAIGRGLSVGQIAENLNLSVHTIHTYRRRVLQKLHLDTNADIIRYAIENDLIR